MTAVASDVMEWENASKIDSDTETAKEIEFPFNSSADSDDSVSFKG